jgi:two-component system, NarL family, sensor kinase
MACCRVKSARVSVRARPASPIGAGLDASQKRRLSKHALFENQLHQLSQRLMLVRDEERRALARELHESAGQSLAALKMTLGNLREALPSKRGRAFSLVESCCKLTEEAVREIRTVSYLMHPPMLEEAGLPSAISWFVRGFSERSNISVRIDVPERFDRLPEEVELTIFRMVQESLTNVYRYSGSATARVCLRRDRGYIRVEVADSGCGLRFRFDPRRGCGTGVGIAGMRERVHYLNGVFEIESAPGRGTTVRALFPDSDVCGKSGTSAA